MTPPRGWVASAMHLLAGDALVRSSLYLTLTSATIAAFGFAFWLLNSRLFTASQVGTATALISGASLISYVSLFGFNITFVRFLPSSRQRNAEINTGLVVVFATSLVAATLYVLLVPSIAPRLAFVRGSFGLAAGFVVLTAFWSTNLVTDSVFIAFRKAQYNLLVDGMIQGAVKLALPALLVGLGAFGIFMSSGLAAAAAVAASIVFMMRTVDYQPKLSLSPSVLRRTWEYSAANYAASLLNLGALLTIPLLVLGVRGPRETAFYYIAFQVASLLFSTAYAVSASLLAEGSYEGSHLPSLVLRSAKILALVCVPSSALLALTGHWLLLLFGHAYSANATSALTVLALSTPSVALYSAATTVLRITGQLRALVAVNAVYALAIVSLTLVAAKHGLDWVAIAWLLSNTAAGLLAAGLATLRFRSRRHGMKRASDATSIAEVFREPDGRVHGRGGSDNFLDASTKP